MDLALEHRFSGPPIRGRLLERPNRFIAVVELDRGETVRAHLADRGRLEDVVYPGCETHVVHVSGAKRKTEYTVRATRARGGSNPPLVCVDPAGANRLARALIERGAFEELPPFHTLRSEVRHGSSRFDFCLDTEGGEMFVEVKSVGACREGVGMFPDAPSERARRHTLELAEHAEAGESAAILLIAQRGDVERIAPHPVDPKFAEALAAARAAGVLVLGAAFEVSPEELCYIGRRPVTIDR